MIITLLLLAAIFTFIVTVIGATGPIVDEGKVGIAAISSKGWAFCFAVLVSAVLPVLVYVFQDKQQQQDQRDLKRSYDSSASVLEDALVASRDSTTHILAAYGYKLDLRNDTLEKLIRDSAKKTIVNGELPSFELYPGKPFYFDGEKKLMASYRVLNATATNMHFKYSIVTEDTTGGYRFADEGELHTGNSINNGTVSDSYLADISFEKPGFKLFIWVRGSYTSLRNEPMHYDEVFMYTVSRRSTEVIYRSDLIRKIKMYVNQK